MMVNGVVDWLFEGGGKGRDRPGGAPAGSWISQALSWVVSMFADGGIMTSRGPVPLRRYAGGGIATSPQLAMFGEGSGAGGLCAGAVGADSGRAARQRYARRHDGADQHQRQHGGTRPAVRSSGGGNGRGGNMMEQARELGAIVTAMVNKNLQDQMRPGGLLNPSGSFSAGVVQ